MKDLFTKREQKILWLVIIIGTFFGFCDVVGIIDQEITNPVCVGEILILTLAVFIALWRYVKKYESD